MKTSIVISGQIGGNHTLAAALNSFEAETERTIFNGFCITFPTKTAARKALWEGFNYLKKTLDEPRVGSFGGLRYAKKSALYWDASQAVIE